VIAFQRAQGLKADGLVGAETARALNRALAQAG
jgi:peptidoglycan hydrolase-like protein with peptidoglycan-binding domain